MAYADGANHKLVVEFAIPGAPTDTIDVKILQPFEDSFRTIATIAPGIRLKTALFMRLVDFSL